MIKESRSLEEEVERVRRKRKKPFTYDIRLRNAINAVFLLLSAIGLIMYFCYDDMNIQALFVIGIGMLFKVADFILRFIS